MIYANDMFFEPLSLFHQPRVLYVGVGHGLDAVISLLDGKIGSAVGVDPYEADAGNDDEDYETLQELVTELQLTCRFQIIRSRVEDYLLDPECVQDFDVVICNDVLHHIYWTEDRLSGSRYETSAVELFRGLLASVHVGGMLAISDVMRTGLRPWLSNRGILGGDVDYKAKQDWREWEKVAVRAGWHFQHRETYVPYSLRHFRGILSGSLGGITASEKYFLYFSRG